MLWYTSIRATSLGQKIHPPAPTTHFSARQAKEYPEAAKAVLENFYMDDYLDSVESPERALIRSKELAPITHFTEPKVIVSSKEESMHVLGLKWDHNNDTLVVSRGTSRKV